MESEIFLLDEKEVLTRVCRSSIFESTSSRADFKLISFLPLSCSSICHSFHFLHDFHFYQCCIWGSFPCFLVAMQTFNNLICTFAIQKKKKLRTEISNLLGLKLSSMRLEKFNKAYHENALKYLDIRLFNQNIGFLQ